MVTRRVLLSVLILVPAIAAPGAELSLIPQPRLVKLAEGAMPLTSAGRIVAGKGKLGPLAAVLSDEIYLASGVRLPVGSGPARAGDIVLELCDRLDEEAYSFYVTDRALVRGGSYIGLAWGTATLLQALDAAGDKPALPHLSIADQPDAPYRGFMKDVARQEVTIEELHATVELCRLYKVRYLHLHLNDDQAWTFPSKAYPKLGSGNFSAHSGPTPKVYDRQALKALVRFADERGVTIIPELEGPMHSDSLRIPYPEVFDANEGPAHMGIVNTASDDVYPALDTLLGEIVEVFASSPYVHIGCDEVDTGRIPGAPSYKKFMDKHAFKDPGECFAYYVRQMADSAKRHGKTPICWAGAALEKSDPKDLVVMHWTMDPGVAQDCLKKGFRVINAPNLGFAGPHDAARDHVPVGMPQFNYEFNRYVFGSAGTPAVPPSPLVIGGQVNDWESTWDYSLSGARVSVPARTAALWHENRPGPYEEYARHCKGTDALLERLVQPVTVATTSADTFDQTKVIQLLRARRAFTKPVTVSLACPLPGTKVRYTLDGGKPTADSPAPAGPIAIDKTTEMRVALFGPDGRQLAPEQRVIHEK
ncbi:MAG: family 20 glycosylhydrolase, partial [Planctomycetota bacterium]|nr:family 20 glycosylhydrolase [Planctomycetota bacterium]